MIEERVSVPNSDKYDISMGEALAGVWERYPHGVIALNSIGKSDTARRIEASTGWKIPKQVVRVQLAAGYFVDKFGEKVSYFWQALATAFNLENNLPLEKKDDGYTARRNTCDVVKTTEPSAKMIRKTAESIRNGEVEIASALVCGMFLGGELSGNNLGYDFISAIADTAEQPISNVASLLDYDSVVTANRALKMAYRDEGLSLSVGNPNLSPSVSGGAVAKLNLMLSALKN